MTQASVQQHTFGPWRFIQHRTDRQVRGYPPGYGPLVASIASRLYVDGKAPLEDPEAVANGRLIAAAPSLLAAAEAVLTAVGDDAGRRASEPYVQLAEAVKQARGE